MKSKPSAVVCRDGAGIYANGRLGIIQGIAESPEHPEHICPAQACREVSGGSADGYLGCLQRILQLAEPGESAGTVRERYRIVRGKADRLLVLLQRLLGTANMRQCDAARVVRKGKAGLQADRLVTSGQFPFVVSHLTPGNCQQPPGGAAGRAVAGGQFRGA